MKNLFFLLIGALLVSCGGNSSNVSSAPAADINLEGYTIKDFDGGVKKASKTDTNGQPIEEGELVNGKKSGGWVTFYPEDGRVKSITTFANGKKNGVHLELNNRGSVELQCHYVDDILHGQWTKYKFGSRAEKEVNYNMGKIDGFYREYHSNGKKQKEIEYKNGVQHGVFRQFNDEEQVVMEYVYENGEKVSGGIVTPGG